MRTPLMTRPGSVPASKYLTRAAAAKYAGVSLRTIARWLSEGLLTRYGTGARGVLVSKSELDELLSPKVVQGQR